MKKHFRNSDIGFRTHELNDVEKTPTQTNYMTKRRNIIALTTKHKDTTSKEKILPKIITDQDKVVLALTKKF